jgi:DNA-binding NtrC family response regulator
MPFVALNCAALPDSLVESELFGHEKGAFTGAAARRKGKFELADGGTLFLDEIGDMAPGTQAKVLRVLEERRVERLGSHESIAVDPRIVSATHRDLPGAIASGEFRQDLYYRLHVVTIELPPLRERPDDVEPLLEHYGRTIAARHRIEWPGLSRPALEALLAYPWPGNVRELRNLVERSVVLGLEGPIDLAELPTEVLAARPAAAGGAPDSTDPGASDLGASDLGYEAARAAFERRYLLQVLERHKGNISQAAAAIGMHRQTLQYKLKQLGIRKSWSD